MFVFVRRDVHATNNVRKKMKNAGTMNNGEFVFLNDVEPHLQSMREIVSLLYIQQRLVISHDDSVIATIDVAVRRFEGEDDTPEFLLVRRPSLLRFCQLATEDSDDVLAGDAFIHSCWLVHDCTNTNLRCITSEIERERGVWEGESRSSGDCLTDSVPCSDERGRPVKNSLILDGFERSADGGIVWHVVAQIGGETEKALQLFASVRAGPLLNHLHLGRMKRDAVDTNEVSDKPVFGIAKLDRGWLDAKTIVCAETEKISSVLEVFFP